MLWSIVSEILVQAYPRKRVGRSRVCFRRILNGIIYRMRTGTQWNRLPKEFGDDSTVHRWFQRWCEDQLMARIWSVLATQCSYLGGVHYPLKRRRWWDPSPASLGQLVFDPGEISPFGHSGINTEPRKSNLQRTPGGVGPKAPG